MSLQTVPIAEVAPEDRYDVTKVNVLTGKLFIFYHNNLAQLILTHWLGVYNVTFYVGFMEKANINNNEMIDKLCILEKKLNPMNSNRIVEDIYKCSRVSTHM